MKDCPNTDAELIEWLQGPPDQYRKAVKCLYKTERKNVVYVLKRYKCPEPVAEELFQDALLVLTNNIGQIAIQKTLSSYIKGICIKRYISISRKKGLDVISADAENAPEIKDMAAELNAMDLALESDNEGQELLAALRYSMSQLNDECQQVLEKRYFEGYSVSEIAEEAEINNQSVSNKLSRCIKRLRKVVESTPYLEQVLRERL